MFDRLIEQAVQQPLVILFVGFTMIAVAIVILTGEPGWGILFMGISTAIIGAIATAVKYDVS